MSHNYLRDRDYLKSFLGSEAAYTGMLGACARLERLLDDLASEGVRPSGDQLGRVYGPAGLEPGGEGPEEIAAAIVAEILAASRGRLALCASGPGRFTSARSRGDVTVSDQRERRGR